MQKWSELVGKHRSKDAIRDDLNLEQVIAHELGVQFDEWGKAVCPFHDDREPSFAVFESDDGTERAGCWSCEWRGDVFDVIREARQVSFQEAVAVAERLGKSLPKQPRRERDEHVIPVEEMRAACLYAYNLAADIPGPIERFIVEKGLRCTASWLRQRWFVGVRSAAGHGTITIPHFDPDLTITGYKVRSARTPTIAAKGSRFNELYGTWADFGDAVLLCEGETDTWSASWLADSPALSVMGLPTGANSPIRNHWLEQLAGRYVRICFDPDKPGMDAARRWAEMLGDDCEVIELPDGLDLTRQPLAVQERVVNGD